QFLGGSLGIAHVPGQTFRPVLIFVSSPVFSAISTVLFALLSGVMLFSHFRRGKGETFTLFSIASALGESNLPTRFSQYKEEKNGLNGQQFEERVKEDLGEQEVVLRKNLFGVGVHQLEFRSEGGL
ncbi:hypothetical protein BDN72DRAFT_898559, partial [Pluteus cervinus]